MVFFVVIQVCKRLASVSSLLPISYVSLLGDNFYPSGVSNEKDVQFLSIFEQPFGHPSLTGVCVHC